MQPPNVYSGHYRFLAFRGGGNLLRIPWEAASTMRTRLSSGSNLRDCARLTGAGRHSFVLPVARSRKPGSAPGEVTR